MILSLLENNRVYLSYMLSCILAVCILIIILLIMCKCLYCASEWPQWPDIWRKINAVLL